MNKIAMNERSQLILMTIVSRYIRDGQPVGSKTVVEETGTSLSTATIRNIMADLEEAGYLISPHTSAGRIPTVMGYRFYVDCLLKIQDIQQIDTHQIRQQLDYGAGEQSLVESVSSLLSGITHLAGIVTMPRREQVKLRHLEFLSLSDNRVLVILVLNEQEVHNQIIYTERHYSSSELQAAANFLVSHYAGMTMLEIREKLFKAMQDDRKSMENMMQTVMDMAEKTFSATQSKEEDYVIAGEANLLDMAEEKGVDRLRSLFDAFTQKRGILYLLDQCLHSDGIQIFIGGESGYNVLDDCSLVTAPYLNEGRVLGVLGVIGPTRMNYKLAISAVDVTAKLLSAVMTERLCYQDK